MRLCPVRLYETRHTQRGGIKHPGSTIAEQVAEASYKTESKILYDHMYNLLENKLDGAIVETDGLSRQNYADILGPAFMIKAQGTAEIADFQRIKTVFDEFNKIVKAMNYVSTYNERQTIEVIKAELWNRVKAEKDRKRKTKLQGQMTELGKQLDKQGSTLDDTFLESISYITDMFCSDRIEVTIHPAEDSEVIFRGILDKQWLRVSAEFLRALYGGYSAPNWVMVGHLTYLPIPTDVSPDLNNELSEDMASDELLEDITSDELPGDIASDNTDLSTEETPNTMRDAYRILMTAYQEIEKTFTDSEDFVEVIVWPLAIYRETGVPDVKEDLTGEGTARIFSITWGILGSKVISITISRDLHSGRLLVTYDNMTLDYLPPYLGK
ncbi:MAG: hypothetical protein GY845_26540, partial [Planctomycetes bacterium]|nr:hypothetical protein [Planctomycetota bacterium]